MSDSTTGITSVDQAVVWSVALAAIFGALAVLWRAIRRITQAVENFSEDWQGTPARPGVPARPGMMERVGGIERRLGAVEHELHPNSGLSLRDAVNRIEDSVCAGPTDS